MLVLSERAVVRVLTARTGAPYLRLEVTRNTDLGKQTRKIPIFEDLWRALDEKANVLGHSSVDQTVHLVDLFFAVKSEYKGDIYIGDHCYDYNDRRLHGGWNLTVQEFQKLISKDIRSVLSWMMKKGNHRPVRDFVPPLRLFSD